MKKILVLILFALSVWSFGQSRYPYSNSAHLSSGSSGSSYTDDFESYSAGGLGGQGNWVAARNNLTVIDVGGDNRIHGGASSDQSVVYYNKTLTNDQSSQITIDASASSTYVGVCVRASGSGATLNCYGYYYRNGTDTFFKFVNGVKTNIGTGTNPSMSSGDILRIEAIGTSIKVYINDIEQRSTTDSDISSGYAGVVSYDNATTPSMDDWEGKDL